MRLVHGFEEIKHSTPKPTDGDPDAIELIEKTSHKAPSTDAIAAVVAKRQTGVEALFDVLIQEDLLEEILISSIDVFKECPPKGIFDSKSEFCIDIPTAITMFGHIVEVNIGGFEGLGKSWHPLKKILEDMGAKI